MPSARANGIDLHYDSFGNPADPTLLLIMGLGTQMIAWDEEFCRQIAEHGIHVVRFDNRDVGLSAKVEGGPPPDVAAAIAAGDTSTASYTLWDMAADAAGLLDALCVDHAHIAGASMGGYIAQCFAIAYPERTLSLCSIMSSTGDRSVGQPTAEALAFLLSPPPATRDAAVERAVEASRVIGSKGLPVDVDRLRARAGQAYDRTFYPQGVARQLLAILATGDRTEKLRGLDVPTVVIHGTDDTLVQPDGGEATAKAIPGAELVMIDGMGHDLPPAAWPRLVDVIASHVQRVEATLPVPVNEPLAPGNVDEADAVEAGDGTGSAG